MNYHIGEYEIRTDTHELFHNSSPQKVEPLTFKLLLFMLHHPNRVLSRDELIGGVWKSQVISDSALNATICATRRAIGDNASKQNCIKTVSGEGYRFIADFTFSENRPEQLIESDSYLDKSNANELPIRNESLIPLQIPDKPSLAVMDFIDQKPSENSQFYTEAITTEINSGLARISHLFVIARPSASRVTKLNLIPTEISQCLGVRYLIYGSTFITSNNISITLSIVDAVNNEEIWSDHFSHSFDDVFLIQQEIIQTIITCVDRKIEQREIERAFLIPTDNLNAWENYHRGYWHMNRTTNKDVDSAQNYFKNAIKQDARFARAYAGISYTHTSRCLLQHEKITPSDNDILQSIEYAQQSIDYCSHETMGAMTLGRARLFSSQVSRSLLSFDRVINHTPNNSLCFLFKGLALSRLNNQDKALQSLKCGERLNPLHSMANVSHHIALAMILHRQKKYQKAVNACLIAIHSNENYYLSYAVAAGCLQLAGNTEKAQEYARQALKILPKCTIDSCDRTFPVKKQPREIFINALIAAGIPKAG